MRDKTPFREYIERTEKIRALSTISLEHINTAEDYQNQLKTNFTHIGELAALNREFLEKELFTLIGSDEIIEKEDVETLLEFSDSLISANNSENLDLSIVSVIQEKLLDDSAKGSDPEEVIRFQHLQIGVYYELMLLTSRIRAYPEIAEKYRQKGLKLAKAFMHLAEKESIRNIKDPEMRDMILTNARYGVSFYEAVYNDPEMNRQHIEYLKKIHEIANDPFYKDIMGEDFDWTYFMFRLYQYSSVITEVNNLTGFNAEQLECIYHWTMEYDRFWLENKDYVDENLSATEDYSYSILCVIRACYLTGRISRDEYLDKLLDIYDNRNINSYSAGDYCGNLFVPTEILAIMDKDHLTEKEKTLLLNMYKNIISYAFYMPNDGSLIVFLELFCKFVELFIEIPSAITFEDFMLQSMAALHPPTYVHTQMVGRITECLCTHLIRLMPEKLIGVKGTKTVEEVLEKKEAIINYAYHAALCHDCGKLYIIDIIFIYGRKLLDMEFDLIKTHPRTGYNFLSRFESTKEYAEVALGHHKWHDDSRGYPEEYNSKESPVKSIMDIVMCADCLDAATDTVGRSYNKGKTVESFTEELKAGSGDHYAPWLKDLFSDADVKEDINYLLTEGRNQKYKDIYYLLKNVWETSEKSDNKLS